MIYLFSRNGLKFLESVCFTQTLFAFDFDGTLSKIVKNPNDAKINVSNLKLLHKLKGVAPVAIISGRSLADLQEKFDPPPGYLIGNHGLEGILSGSQRLYKFRDVCEQWKSHLMRSLVAMNGGLDGVEIEDKTYSIAVHYRKSRSKKIAKAMIIDALKDLTPSARVILGKCVVNLVPSGAPHKGIALLELIQKSKSRSALYIGDDDTDEDVFSLPDPRVFTIRVGQKKSSQAKFYIKRQEEVNLLLKQVLAFFEQSSGLKRSVFREKS